MSLLAYLKKMLGSTAFEPASSKLPPASTVTKPGCRATKEEESVSKANGSIRAHKSFLVKCVDLEHFIIVIACGMIVSSPRHGSFKLKLDRNPGRETVTASEVDCR
ncbi:MAG: hypothetical protein ACLQDC_15990 [Verrucomicrobiia bacterium]